MASGFMKKHLSRRELTRRMEQGREAMRVLAAVVVQAGGMVRVQRDVFGNLPVGHTLTATRDALTGDLILRCGSSGERAEEMTFDDIRARYGTRHDAEVPEPARDDRSLARGGVSPDQQEEI